MVVAYLVLLVVVVGFPSWLALRLGLLSDGVVASVDGLMAWIGRSLCHRQPTAPTASQSGDGKAQLRARSKSRVVRSREKNRALHDSLKRDRGLLG